MKKFNIFIAIIFLSLFLSCTLTPFFAFTKQCEIISEPSGMIIEIDDEYVGKTPLMVDVKRDWSHGSIKVTVIPDRAGLYVQSKFMYRPEFPKKIYFNMYLRQIRPKYEIEINK